MRNRGTQLGVRKNPGSLRVHGLRPVANSLVSAAGRSDDSNGRNKLPVLLGPRLARLQPHVIDVELGAQWSAGQQGGSGESPAQRVAGNGVVGAQLTRTRGNWSVSPLWQGKILLGVLREQGLAGRGLLRAFEKWLPLVAGCSRADMASVYRTQTGREMSDYILVQQADKVVRYGQLPSEAAAVRRLLLSPDSTGASGHVQENRQKSHRARESSLSGLQTAFIDRTDPNVLLTTSELAKLTGFRPKTIRRWVSRKLLNHIRVGNRLRFRLSAVELFLAQREVQRS